MKNELGKYLRKLRKSRKLPLKTVASYTGKTVSYISDIELGRRGTDRLNTELLIKLATFFDVPVTIMLEKSGYEVVAGSMQYKEMVKVLRNKTKAALVTDKLATMKELIEQLESAGMAYPAVRGLAKSLMISLSELESVIGEPTRKSA